MGHLQGIAVVLSAVLPLMEVLKHPFCMAVLGGLHPAAQMLPPERSSRRNPEHPFILVRAICSQFGICFLGKFVHFTPQIVEFI
jgi:hypothetical protein